MGLLCPRYGTLYLPLWNFSRSVKERVEIQSKMKKKYAKLRAVERMQRDLGSKRVKKDNKNMDKEEMKWQTCILWLLCFYILFSL